MLLVLVALIAVSVIVRYVFPAGAAAHGARLWGGAYADWQTAQFAILCVLTLGVLVHLMLHWNWVCSFAATRWARWRGRAAKVDEGSQTLVGVGLLIALVTLVGLLVAAATLAIELPPR